jgi:uncharacterized membrane protein YqjE
MADEVRITPAHGPPPAEPRGEPSLGELFRQLAEDTSGLIKQELALARVEMRENLQSATRAGVKVAAGGAVALIGALVLVAFLVLLLGELLGIYWLSALIVGLVFVAIGGFLVKSAMNSLTADNLKPDMTVETLKEDKEWLQNEIRDVRRDLT